MTLLGLSNVGVQFGADTLFSNITFTVAAGERWGIIGRNGTGKTTLFKLITGAQQPTTGVISRQPSLTVSLLDQHRDFGTATTVWEAAAGAFAHLIALEKNIEALGHEIAEDHSDEAAHQALMSRYAQSLEKFQHEGGYTYASQVDAVLDGIGFDHEEARTRPLKALSGGERGRLALARQLVSPSDLLLLDEPTNHLDLDTTLWLENYLKGSQRTFLLVSHDRAFLSSMVDHVLHFEAGTATPYAGTYESFVRQRTEARLTLQRQFDKQQRSIASEEDYIRRNIAGQNTAQAKGRRKRLARLPRLSPPPSAEAVMSLRLEAAERGPDRVVIAEHASVSIPGHEDAVLLRNFTSTVHRGDRVGLVGPNGAGKSTLLHAIVNENATSGRARLGSGVRVAIYRQDLAQVPLDRTIYHAITDLRPLWERGAVQGHLGRFGFSGDEVKRRTSTLSGGERARLALAMIMLSHANLLILDEPTNHLDVETIEALEDAIEDYDGTVVLVSHDRELLRSLTTRTWSLRHQRITDYPGGYAEWELRDDEPPPASAPKPVAKREEVKTNRDTSRREDDRARRTAQRKAQEDSKRLEAEVERLDARVAEIEAVLGDPSFYTGPRAKDAQSLGVELDDVRAQLERAMAEWSQVVEVLEGAQ